MLYLEQRSHSLVERYTSAWGQCWMRQPNEGRGLAVFLTILILSLYVFSPHQAQAWESMPISGLNGKVYASARDANGNIYVGGDFTLAGGIVANHVAKWNGTTWTALSTGLGTGKMGNGDTVRSLALDSNGNLYAGGQFYLTGGYNVAKWNGTSWAVVGGGLVNSGINFLTVDTSGNLYVGGYIYSVGGTTGYNVAKWNGSTWSVLGSGMDADVWSLAVDGSGNLYACGRFTTVGGMAANYIAKWDGSTWSSLGTGTNGFLRSLAFDSNGNLYAGGYFTTAGQVAAKNVAKWDGSQWSALGSGVSYDTYAITVDSNNNLYAADFYNNGYGVGKWNGTEWSNLGTGANQFVQTLTVDSNGNLYAGGWFGNIGGVAANYIAKWSGSAWTLLGSLSGTGMNDLVTALVADNTGNLYAGGAFTSASGVTTANYIAKWNGTNWTSLGSGLNSSVTALALDSNNLYVSGYFNSSGALWMSYIGKWNGSDWSPLGTGLNYYANAIVSDGSGNLYVGGCFSTAGGMTVNHIAKWNGSSWSALGSGMNDCVNALALDQSGNLYAGGNFTTANGVTANYIAKWDGSNWQPLGTGMSNPVYKLVFGSNGNLYAGGPFNTAGGVPAKGIAKWDGSSWSALGTAAYGSISSLTFDSGGTLYVGGWDLAFNNGVIAKWDGSNWSNVGTGANGYVTALTFDSNGNLWAGGNFNRIDGTIASYISYDINGGQPPTSFALTVAKAGSGTGTITSTPSGLNCGSTCSYSFNSGTSITLTATPDAGSTFSSWSGDTDCTDGQVTIDAAKSCTATFAIAPTAPTATTMAASNITTTTATLNATVNDHWASTAVAFQFGPTSSSITTLSAVPATINAGAGSTAVSQARSALTCNTTYHYKVKATNSVTTTYGDDLTFTTLACATAPTATATQATAIGLTSATLNGTVNDNRAAVTSIVFLSGLTNSYGFTSSAAPYSIAANSGDKSVSVTRSGLTCGTLYHYAVKAVNSAGATTSSDASFQTLACLPIVATSPATSITYNSAVLNGQVSAGGANAAVTFDYGTSISYGSSIVASPGTVDTSAGSIAVTANLGALTCNTQYYYRVTAVNSSGTKSAVSSGFKTAACPVDIALTLHDNHSSDTSTRVTPGAALTYLAQVSNNGPLTASNAVLKMPARPGLTVADVTCTATNGALCPTSLTVTALQGTTGLVIPTLPVGGHLTFTITTTVTTTSGIVAYASLTVPSGTTDTNAANNTSIHTIVVAKQPDLVVTSIVLNPTIPAANGTFSALVTVENQGNAAVRRFYMDLWTNQPDAQNCDSKGDAWIDATMPTGVSTTTVTINNLQAGDAGTKTLRAFADSWCEIGEPNRANNQSAVEYTVQ